MAADESGGLSLRGVTAGYGRSTVLHGIDIEVRPGQKVAILGPNGAGKTTVLRAVSGLVGVRSGTITLGGAALTGRRPDEIVKRGVAHVPQGRRVFPDFTVEENLRAAAYSRGGRDVDDDVARVLDAFPRLRDRFGVRAGFLSGGEQQMLAIGRAVVQRPRIVLIDEMSLGLAPILIKELYGRFDRLFADVPAVIVEQNPSVALEHCSYVYVLSNGEVKASGPASEFTSHERLMQAYAGAAD
ncbi:ABC transporter ATP-binding protein [Pseudonocardia benzenivorans]|uniref:ABC transporter related protein n=2 Tax=Pseudonocardia TaxID=1847 RepID=F4CZ70_PSEUX|nr:ABC transporter ATP-binding protein [Pseudonocardia dioxanivorans]AEA24774.1 ABC transporter related protein [Pseudonocardia dioxanivorans CB1190]GJF01294.1 ABC transporter ATP-binding protein [Pseudonocardia sp. D17]